MIATASGAMLAGVSEAEPDRMWFGRGGCVEQHDDGTFAVFVRGELLGTFSADDVATRDVFIAVVMEQAEREDLALAFRVSPATVGRVVTRFKAGGFRAVADYGRVGGRRVVTAKLEARLAGLFEQGTGPRAAHRAVARQASYGTVHGLYRQWLAEQAAKGLTPAAPQQVLPLEAANEPASSGVAEASPAAAAPEEAHQSSDVTMSRPGRGIEVRGVERRMVNHPA